VSIFKKNKNTEPLLISVCVAAFLTFLSFYPEFFSGSRKINLLTDILVKPPRALSIPLTVEDTHLPANDSVTRTQSILNAVKKDTLERTYKAGELALLNFFEALQNQKNEPKKIRIAWFGDSMIEGDLITDDFRKILQKIYGGEGVGFVPITSPVAQFRQSIRHTFSDDWQVYNFMKKPPKGTSLGISGNTFISSTKSWVNYSVSKSYPNFNDVRLLCKQCSENSLKIITDSAEITFPVDSIASLKEIVIHEKAKIKKLKIECEKSDCILYGTYFDNGPGVYVDNFSFRGNSGIPLSILPLNELYEIGKKENYKLIILSYGLNVVAHEVKKYGWYQAAFAKTVAHIQQAFPDASILLMSVGDKSYRIDDDYETEPDIPLFVAMQKKIAEDAGVSFWNLYEAMGGYNSMKKWAEGNPRLANLDYTHPNFAGGKKIAQLLYSEIDKNYNNYLQSIKPAPEALDSHTKDVSK
jgi:lysophospholipase L1-like esterase